MFCITIVFSFSWGHFNSQEKLGDIKYLILMLEIGIITVIVKGRVLLEIPSMHKLVQYFQTLHRNEDIHI